MNGIHSKSGDSDQAAQAYEILISICIPTLNRARYLSEAIESLVPQLAPDIELLVYDTGSTDGTRELIERFRHRFPELRFFSLDTRRGFDETALLLLEQCRGEYVWLFGSDDLLKEGAIDAVRQRILRSPVRPSFLYLNHEIIADHGNLLIPSNLGRKRDREFRDGRQCVAWLGLFLGYISACVFRRDPALSLTSAKEFDGSLWMGLYLNLVSLSKGGPALYLGQPLVSARRNPGNTYDYGEVFCRGASRVFWKARGRGIGCFTIYRGMNRTVRVLFLRFCLSWRSDDPAQLSRTFPVMLRTCWMYPWFWLLIVPVRLTPAWLARAVRNRVRRWREWRNNGQHPSEAQPDAAETQGAGNQANVLQGAFHALLRARKLAAATSTDHLWKAIPLLIPAYRNLYARLRPNAIIRAEFRGHAMCFDPGDLGITRNMLALGTWEPFETDVFLHVLEKGMTVVDAGANIGQYTLEAARSVGDEGRVFAFEPEPRNFALLCRNIQANGYRNVTSVRKALSNRCGVARLALSPDNLGEHHIETSSVATDCIDVDILTLDEYFRDKPRKIDVIKMDTQGAETAIFEGMGGLLETNPDLILFAEFWPKGIRAAGHDPEKFLETLAASGFRVGIVNQEKARIEALPTGHLGEIVRSLLHEDHARFYVNLLCLRGKAIRGPFGPHEWWHGPAYARAAFAGQN